MKNIIILDFIKKVILLFILLGVNNANAYFYTTLKQDLQPFVDRLEELGKLDHPDAIKGLEFMEANILIKRDEAYKALVYFCQDDINKYCVESKGYYEHEGKCLSDKYENLGDDCKYAILQIFGPKPKEKEKKLTVKKVRVE